MKDQTTQYELEKTFMKPLVTISRPKIQIKIDLHFLKELNRTLVHI